MGFGLRPLALLLGDPAHVVNFMHFIAQEMRELMAASLETSAQQAAQVEQAIAAMGRVFEQVHRVGELTREDAQSREEVARAGGRPLAELCRNPTREAATPVMAANSRSDWIGNVPWLLSASPCMIRMGSLILSA